MIRQEQMIAAWLARGVDENNLDKYTDAERINFFRHACLIGYAEKALLLAPLVHDKLKPDLILREVTEANRLNVIEALKSAGWDLSAGQDTALMVAVNFGYKPIIEYLLQNGADAAARGGKPLDVACEKKDAAIINMLINTKKYTQDMLFDVCMEATKVENMEALDIIVGNHFDVSHDDHRLIYRASLHDRAIEKALKFLVCKKGADVHARGEKPFAHAVMLANPKNAGALIDAGADPVLMSASDWQIATERAENIQKIIRDGIALRGAEALAVYQAIDAPQGLLDAVDARGTTGLMAAVRAGKLGEVIEKILDAHSDMAATVFSVDHLTKKTSLGVSALDLVVRTGQIEALFTPRLWGGRYADAAALFSLLPEAAAEKAAEPLSQVQQHDLAAERQKALKSGGKKRWNLNQPD